MNNIKEKSESVINTKSYAFALEVIKIYKYLINDKKEFVMSKQLLRSGTSIGANINEAISGQLKRDFVYKLSIALKETRETLYWLKLLTDSGYIELKNFDTLSRSCGELIRKLSSIILTTKEKYFQNPKETTHNS